MKVILLFTFHSTPHALKLTMNNCYVMKFSVSFSRLSVTNPANSQSTTGNTYFPISKEVNIPYKIGQHI